MKKSVSALLIVVSSFVFCSASMSVNADFNTSDHIALQNVERKVDYVHEDLLDERKDTSIIKQSLDDLNDALELIAGKLNVDKEA